MTEKEKQNVVVLEKKTLYEKFFRVDEYKFRHPLYKGGMSDVVKREVMERGHAVGVLLYDPKQDKVALVEQFRCGVYLNREDPWMLEVVAGMIDHGNETPEQVARREAMEEAGAEIKRIEPITRYYSSPGGMTETLSVFCGMVDIDSLPEYGGLDSEAEDIRVVIMKFEDAVKKMQAGFMNNAVTIVAMQWLMLNKNSLVEKWGEV